MYRKANNVFAALLSDVSIATSTLPAAGAVITKDNISAGAVVFVDAGMRRTTWADLATGDKYHIVQGRGAALPLMKSAAVKKGSENITIQKHLPAQQQISVIGSNGTTGALPSANDTSYYIKIRKNDNDEGNRSQPFSLFGQYQTSGSATQVELAFGLAENLAFNMAEEANATNGYILVEVLIDTAVGNTELGGLGNPTGNLVVTNNSKEVTMTDTQDLAAGDYLRFGASATEALTDAVYRIVSVDSTTKVTLDMPYQGVSNAAYDDDFVHLILAATGDADNFGIRLTGVESDFSVSALRNYFANRFTATFNDTDVPVTLVQGARNGSGVWQQVANDEYLNYGFEGQNKMISTPPTARDQVVKIPGVGVNTALTSKYSTVNIKWTEDINYLVSASKAEGNVLIHLNLLDDSGVGKLDTATENTGETLAKALGLTPSDLDEA